MSSSTPVDYKTYLILGGARSGKSSYAEKLAEASGKEVIYLATAQALDDEMKQRITHHKNNRPSNWTIIEEPLELAQAIKKWASPSRIILVDCLTMWITNLLSQNTETDSEAVSVKVDQLIKSLPKNSGSIIFVSNEVSMGVIPMGELTRKYVDESGRLHQQLAQHVDSVTLMVAGLPLIIKPQK